ncbi:hypothetical protein SB717_38100, partial [Priestia sp. SIMBA_032]
ADPRWVTELPGSSADLDAAAGLTPRADVVFSVPGVTGAATGSVDVQTGQYEPGDYIISINRMVFGDVVTTIDPRTGRLTATDL